MANIIGSEGTDILQGTNGDDDIQALGGNDVIFGSTGFDKVDGGAGNDTIDFSGVDRDILLFPFANAIATASYITIPTQSNDFSTTLSNIETAIGNPNRSNTISNAGRFPTPARLDADLSNNRVTYYNFATNTTKTVTVKNFDNIENDRIGNNRVKGNDRDNKITLGADTVGFDSNGSSIQVGNNIVIGSKGNDTVSANNTGSANNTIDYSNLGRSIKFSLSSKLFNPIPQFARFDLEGKTDKGSFGTDTSNGFQKIVGATNKDNTLDLSNSFDGVSVELNLLTNSAKFNLPKAAYLEPSTQQFEFVNFVDAIGTKGNDKIVGGNKNSNLTGGGGNDTITGGSKKDLLTGTDSNARGVGEVDTLTGGGGKDKFILGDKNGAYYLGNGNNDYATITDFDVFNDSIDLGKLKDYSLALEGNNTVDLFSGKDVNTRDLIAKIQFADIGYALSHGSSLSTKSSSIVDGSNLNIDPIISKIDILSGSNVSIDS
jgi:serralysin